MPLRPLVLLSFVSLLVACSSDAPKPAEPASGPAPQMAQKKAQASADQGPLPAYQRELSGSLQGVPAGAEVELALLVVGELVMAELQKLDEVAYIRFASVYRRFQDLNEFREEIDRLAREPVKE